MSSYGFKKSAPVPAKEELGDKLDLSGIRRAPVALDPQREEEAVVRGAAMGFVDRDERPAEAGGGRPTRRRREAVPQGNLFIKGPQDTLDWFVEFTNARGHRAYWQALEELRALSETKAH